MRDSAIFNDLGEAIRSSTSTTNGIGPGSNVIVEDSTVSGVGAGVVVGPVSLVSLSGTSVHGRSDSKTVEGEGVRVSGGSLQAIQKSFIEGTQQGIKIIDNVPSGFLGGNIVIIDESVVRGVIGAAIFVNASKIDTDIEIRNGADLFAGNGNLLQVEGSGTTRLKVDDSRLNGNLTADDTSTLNVTLQNYAQLTGNIINSNTLAITSGASWQMVDDSNVKALSMNGGRVSFGEGAFKTLTLGELSGNGTFDMRINLDNHSGDLLKVNGQANGNHTLKVQNTGLELVTPEVEPLMVVDTEGGDAQFGLLGGKADLGVYSYELEQRGDDWFIVGSGKTISPSTQSVLALFNAAPNIWNSELTTLRSRMGEVRGKPLGGAWMRSYGSRFNASTGDGVDYQQKQSGLTLGVDAPLQVGIGELSLGVMAGYSKNDLDLSRGTTGNVDSYYVGGYGTWLLDDGYYLDGVLKLNRFRNESKVAMSDGTKAKGDYESSAVGGSLEFGRHINFADGYFLEPYAQLSSVWVQGDSYTLDNGMQANNERTQSTLGKVGTSAGRSIALKDGGVLTPYLRVAMAQEFSRSNDVKVNDKRFGNDLSGSRAELGAGVSVSLSERLQLHADFDYMKGKNVEQPWGANVGLRLAF
ncbi:autotransporter outer membrane beta-barrel domain-containing protein [Pseudomonas sp. DSP3-2-2]|uniref:autotransporter outer membrane beta-barrel domain-containing protein n=1 Tax=unclassified Pseudomonas TaxID=196821 RepID=UPI003CF04F02